MAAESFWSAVSSLTTTPISFLYILVLTDRWRYPPRRRRILLAALLTAAGALQCLCLLLMADTMAAKYAVNFISVVFCPLALLLASPWRHGRILFILATGACLSNVCTMLLSFLGLPYSPERVVLKLLLNGGVLLLFYFLFRPRFFDVLQTQAGSWYWLSLLPAAFCICFATLLPHQYDRGAYRYLIPLLVLLGLLVMWTYTGITSFFSIMTAQHRSRRDNALLATRMAAARRQNEARRRESARDRDEREDMLRFLARLSRLLEEGRTDEALGLVEGMDERLTARRPETRRFTADPLLNAVLDYYWEWAGEAGVSLSIQFQLPPHFPLDRSGLAVVLSNALENAMHACQELPREARRIELIGRSTPGQFFLSITNTCRGPVELDPATGRPISRREGHGYGTKSIDAFAAAHDAALQYSADSGSFSLQMLL